MAKRGLLMPYARGKRNWRTQKFRVTMGEFISAGQGVLAFPLEPAYLNDWPSFAPGQTYDYLSKVQN